MNILVGMIVYKRLNMCSYWLKAYNNSYKLPNSKLIVVHNYDGLTPSKDMSALIASHKPDIYLPRENKGQDIGALQDVINDESLEPWDILYWSTDDNIPMKRDFLHHFIAPFSDKQIGIVGNYWVHARQWGKYYIPTHIRTTSFAIRKEIARNLVFPNPIKTKKDCYKFEWLDYRNNMTRQIERMGYKIHPVCGDFNRCWSTCNELVWDAEMLHPTHKIPYYRKNHWNQYFAQFESNNDSFNYQI